MEAIKKKLAILKEEKENALEKCEEQEAKCKELQDQLDQVRYYVISKPVLLTPRCLLRYPKVSS